MTTTAKTTPTIAQQRLSAIATRAAIHASIDRDALGAALQAFADHFEVPAAAAMRDAVIDAELAAYLAAGGNNPEWLAALDAVRDDPDTMQSLRNWANQQAIAGMLRSVRRGVGGIHSLPA